MKAKFFGSSLALLAIGATSSVSFFDNKKLSNIFYGFNNLFSNSTDNRKDLKNEKKLDFVETPQKLLQESLPKTNLEQKPIELIQEAGFTSKEVNEEKHFPVIENKAPLVSVQKPAETIEQFYSGNSNLDSSSGSSGLGVTCINTSGTWWVKEPKDCGFWN